MTSVTADERAAQIHRDIEDVKAGHIGWSDIDIRDVLAAMEDDEFRIDPDDMQEILNVTEEFRLGRDRYVKVHDDRGEVGYQCKDWSYLRFTFNDDLFYVSESHPY